MYEMLNDFNNKINDLNYCTRENEEIDDAIENASIIYN